MPWPSHIRCTFDCWPMARSWFAEMMQHVLILVGKPHCTTLESCPLRVGCNQAMLHLQLSGVLPCNGHPPCWLRAADQPCCVRKRTLKLSKHVASRSRQMPMTYQGCVTAQQLAPQFRWTSLLAQGHRDACRPSENGSAVHVQRCSFANATRQCQEPHSTSLPAAAASNKPPHLVLACSDLCLGACQVCGQIALVPLQPRNLCLQALDLALGGLPYRCQPTQLHDQAGDQWSARLPHI